MSLTISRLATGGLGAFTAAALALPLTLSTAGSAAAAPRAAATPKPCVAAGCTVVSRADVDGDGRADSTSLTPIKRGTAYVVRVVTARGALATRTVATPWLYSGLQPFHGAAALDGVRGSELVIRTGAGAHTQYYTVLTWRSGALVTEKDPSGRTEWVTDGAMSSAIGYRLSTVKGTRQLTSVAFTRDTWNKPATFTGTRVVAAWKNGRWTPITKRTITLPESTGLWAGAGWNVKGLARW